MVMTVGTGTRPDVDITRPLVKSLRNSNPELASFVVTPESESNARRVAEEVGLPRQRWLLVSLDDMEDVNEVFSKVVGAVQRLDELGFPPSQVEVDYTSGTKSMSAGAVAAAVAMGCGSLKYVGGRREHGVVRSGTERIQTMEPGAMLAHQELRRAHDLLRGLRLDTALEVCRGVNCSLLGDDRRDEPKDLEQVIRGFDRWDKFDHRGGAEILLRVDMEKPWIRDYRVSREVLGCLVQVSNGARKRGKIAEELLADLANNAWRRWREGKYDDSVARLYRLVEMIAQRELKERFKISTGNVDLGLAPDGWRERLESYRDQDGKVKTGLKASFSLLEALEACTGSARSPEREPVVGRSPGIGAAFQADGALAELLGKRNASILAHGLEPVEREICEELFGRAMKLAELAMPGFAERRRRLQFPWLREEPDPGEAVWGKP